MQARRCLATTLLCSVLWGLSMVIQPAQAGPHDWVKSYCGIPGLPPCRCGPAQPCVLQNVTVVNLYWVSNWDAAVGVSSLSKVVLDSLTQAIIESGYFKKAEQYNAAGPLHFAGGFLPDPRCLSAENPVDLIMDVPAFIRCVMPTLPAEATRGTLLYNVFLPPAVTADGLNFSGVDLGHCIDNGWNGYHYFINGAAYSVIVTSPACNGNSPPSLDTVAQILSHEMVEALVDPEPLQRGFRHCEPDFLCNQNQGSGVVESLTIGEVADTCSPSGHFTPTPLVDLTFDAPIPPYLFRTQVVPYYSNEDGGCVPTGPLTYLTPKVAGAIWYLSSAQFFWNSIAPAIFGPPPR